MEPLIHQYIQAPTQLNETSETKMLSEGYFYYIMFWFHIHFLFHLWGYLLFYIGVLIIDFVIEYYYFILVEVTTLIKGFFLHFFLI
jgi:hypothetical protein